MQNLNLRNLLAIVCKPFFSRPIIICHNREPSSTWRKFIAANEALLYTNFSVDKAYVIAWTSLFPVFREIKSSRIKVCLYFYSIQSVWRVHLKKKISLHPPFMPHICKVTFWLNLHNWMVETLLYTKSSQLKIWTCIIIVYHTL